MTFRPDLADCHKAARDLTVAARELTAALKRLTEIERFHRDTHLAALRSEKTEVTQ